MARKTVVSRPPVRPDPLMAAIQADHDLMSQFVVAKTQAERDAILSQKPGNDRRLEDALVSMFPDLAGDWPLAKP